MCSKVGRGRGLAVRVIRQVGIQAHEEAIVDNSQVSHGETERHYEPETIHRKLPLPQSASEMGCA